MDKFNYVIARLWSNKNNELCCYTYHSTVFFGNMKDAKNTLEFIKGKADEDKIDQYQIYKINEEPLG